MSDILVFNRLKGIVPNVYPGAAPLGFKHPCAIYNRIRTDPTRNLADDDDSADATYQIDVYSTNQIEANTLAKAIKTSFKAWNDDDVQCAAYTSRQNMVDNTTDTQLFRVMAVYELFVTDE